ncbi:protocatechuate 3,4-dioxygenase subunit alpha [Pandoraea sp.]|uniref:protocatechuate 3,4-dioxygenase subunit alpha n=1 Tax=Pandoraea sp. TaxID=1883445 RepID=UPI00121FE80F|nr:protocatechuate 3,4-dioxygenase subunit alpha [Pandoraea sp.]TAL56439.1 MAG: protocatechuate 3,4-dioxygenase subunit alpha [Pandoraea sp.]TAM15258.1 MAG: protocatechuate 3,4-dioxygenase subunit alpha [Pandoraea sp.]
MTLKQTPSQTVGPYFAYGLCPAQYGYDLPNLFAMTPVELTTPGQRITVVGQVLDGAGAPINDALLEVLQADAAGRYATTHDDAARLGMRGFCRIGTGTDAQHRFVLHTIKPGADGTGSAPHLDVILLMRGMLLHAFTRIYFDDEPEANAADAVLNSVSAARRYTLIARRSSAEPGMVYRFDIHMQGARETVFFDL